MKRIAIIRSASIGGVDDILRAQRSILQARGVEDLIRNIRFAQVASMKRSGDWEKHSGGRSKRPGIVKKSGK